MISTCKPDLRHVSSNEIVPILQEICESPAAKNVETITLMQWKRTVDQKNALVNRHNQEINAVRTIGLSDGEEWRAGPLCDLCVSDGNAARYSICIRQ